MSDNTQESILVKNARPASVRVADPTDFEPIMELLHVMYEDNDMGLPVDWQKVESVVTKCCVGDGGVVGVQYTKNHLLVGATGIVISQPWYSSQWILSQLWLFVRPEFRRGNNFARDLFLFGNWHRADMERRAGVPLGLETSVMSFNRLDAKARLWSRYAQYAGSIFWVAPDGQE